MDKYMEYTKYLAIEEPVELSIEESTVYILTFGSKPVGVYSTEELALDSRDSFISTVDKHKDKTWIDIMFEVVPMQLDMPLDILKIKAN